MLFRFSNELQSGDGVVSYDRTRRVYAVGKVVGQYVVDVEFDPDYPNVRPVEVSWDALTTATKNSLGSTLTLFRLPETADEDVWRAASGEQGDPSEEDEATGDEEEKLLLEDLVSRSIEFIKDRIIGLGWEDLQSLVAGMLRAMGYKTRIPPAVPTAERTSWRRGTVSGSRTRGSWWSSSTGRAGGRAGDPELCRRPSC